MRQSLLSLRCRTIFLLLILPVFASPVSAQTTDLRIMPLGDSITYGEQSTGNVGFRRSLYQSLTGAGYSANFVGSLANGSPADFDRDHEGHSGWRADQIRDSLTAWLNLNPPDVIMLHIGTNDISKNQGTAGTAAEIGQILDLIDTWEGLNHEVWVVLARIINRNDDKSGITTELNGLIQTLADTRIAAGDRIVVVDMESALTYPGDLADIVHPNDSGYGKMAAVWLAAVEALPVSFPSNADHDGDRDVDGSDLASLIANPAMIDVTIFARNFGKTAYR